MKRSAPLHPLAMLAVSAALLQDPATALAADVSMIGTWKIVAAVPAPWSKPEEREDLAAAGRRMLNVQIDFKPAAVSSKFKLFNCKRRVAYDAVNLPVDTLFNGNLPEPNPAAEAARMGFAKGDVPSVDVRCVNARFTFHFRDQDTAMFNLNRVVYTLKRQ
jgi:hypothetical protein